MSNILKIATLKYCGAWKLFGENFPSNPYSLCYDGENIWVAGLNMIKKKDGKGTFA